MEQNRVDNLCKKCRMIFVLPGQDFCHRCDKHQKGGIKMSEKKDSKVEAKETKPTKMTQDGYMEMGKKIKEFADKEFPDLTIKQKLKVNHQYWKLLREENGK